MSSEDAEFDRHIDGEITALNRQNKAARRRNMAVALIAILALIFGMACLFLALDNARLATANKAFGQVQQEQKKEIASEANQALCGTADREIYDRDLCAKWAEVAQEPVAAPEDPVVAPGPTQAEIVAAFRLYCEQGNCRGADGKDPTPDDIAAAFVTFCADGRCTGPAGQEGKQGAEGKPGADGVSPEPLAPQYEMVLAAVTAFCSDGACVGPTGATGPGPTQDMVIAAVQTVCANDACRGPIGPAGAAGATGAQGEPGRGVQSTMCGDDGRWAVTYTDGTTQDGGQCRTTLPVGNGAP